MCGLRFFAPIEAPDVDDETMSAMAKFAGIDDEKMKSASPFAQSMALCGMFMAPERTLRKRGVVVPKSAQDKFGAVMPKRVN